MEEDGAMVQVQHVGLWCLGWWWLGGLWRAGSPQLQALHRPSTVLQGQGLGQGLGPGWEQPL